MTTRSKAKISVILAMSMILVLGCSFGSLLNPALRHTPTPALTSTPESTSTPVPTSTPLFTATFLPTATPQGFAIQNAAFEDFQQDCTTDINITGVDGDSLQIIVNSTLSIINGNWAIFCYGAKHTWIGTLTYGGYTFASDTVDPLQFQVQEAKGYVYLHGKGTVILPDQSEVSLGGAAAGSTRLATPTTAAPTQHAQATAPAPSSQSVLFQDTFDSNANGWETGQSSDAYGELTSQVVGGKFKMALSSKQSNYFAILSVPNFSAKDFLLSMDVTLVDVSAAPGDLSFAITVREADGINGKRYEFMFYNDNTFIVSVWPDSDYQNVKEILRGKLGTAKLEKGITNTFAIQAVGSTFTFSINGEQLGSFTDTTITEAGGISFQFGLNQSPDSATIEFDNLVIKSAP